MQEIRKRMFRPWVRKIPWRREWLLTPLLQPGEFHEQRSLVGYSPWGCRVRYDLATEHAQIKQTYFPIHFIITKFTLIPKPEKDLIRTENCRLIYFMKIEVKIMNKKMTNRIQQYIPEFTHNLSQSISLIFITSFLDTKCSN